jgi:hypothetical protein
MNEPNSAEIWRRLRRGTYLRMLACAAFGASIPLCALEHLRLGFLLIVVGFVLVLTAELVRTAR